MSTMTESNGDVPAIPTSAGPPTGPTRAVSSSNTQAQTTTDPLAGHIGHLTQPQEQAFSTFKSELKQRNLYSDTPSPTHDDGTLLRFLRARRFDVAGAVKQFSECEAWRKQIRIEEIYDGFDIQEFEEAKKVNPMWTGRRARTGQPIYAFRVKDLDKKAMDRYFGSSAGAKNSTSNTTLPSPVVALYEHFTRLVLPLCALMRDRPNTQSPIVSSVNLIDISGVGLMQFVTLRNHLGDASGLATSRYPETLGRIFVIGAPSYMELILTFLRRVFDPITLAKITILPPDKTQAFKRITETIDPDNVPKAYGGNLDWDFGQRPALDPAIAKTFGIAVNAWPVGPARIEGKDLLETGKQADGSMRHTVLGHISSE